MNPIALVLCLALSLPSEDLGQRYPATMQWSPSGLQTQCRAEDVFALKSFSLEFGEDFALSCGKATLAVGVYQTNALWAVVLPAAPAKIRAKDQPGDGETTSAICLRFAPADVGLLFPQETLSGRGDAWRRAEATRLFRRKLGYKWCTPSGNTTVVPGGITLIDVDTNAGKRRFYVLDANAGKLTYVPDFEAKTVPAPAPIAAAEARDVFEQVWSAFDREYANFGLVPGVDWKKRGAEARKSLGRAKSAFELAAVLSEGLSALEDLHVWVRCGDDWLPGYYRERPLNASWRGSQAVVGGEAHDTQHGLVWQRSPDGIGYVNVSALSDAELPAAFDQALEGLSDTWALVVDLRFNGGGDETLAQQVAGRLLDQERVYSKNQYRSGAGHGELGPVLERRFAPRGPWRYEAPVIALQGQCTMSSAESMALMLAQCPAVTTLGERTAGSSANPRRLDFPCGIQVNLPRWRDMDPDGKPIEHAGVAPDVVVEAAPEAFTESADPVLAAALERLRATPAGERKPGKR